MFSAAWLARAHRSGRRSAGNLQPGSPRQFIDLGNLQLNQSVGEFFQFGLVGQSIRGAKRPLPAGEFQYGHRHLEPARIVWPPLVDELVELPDIAITPAQFIELPVAEQVDVPADRFGNDIAFGSENAIGSEQKPIDRALRLYVKGHFPIDQFLQINQIGVLHTRQLDDGNL